MISWKKIHEFMVKALEEPFYRAEMHRVEMALPDPDEPQQLVLIEGGKKNKYDKDTAEMKGIERVAART